MYDICLLAFFHTVFLSVSSLLNVGLNWFDILLIKSNQGTVVLWYHLTEGLIEDGKENK